MMNLYLFQILLILTASTTGIVELPNKRLMNDLIVDYNRNMRPVAKQSDTFDVFVEATMHDLHEMVSFNVFNCLNYCCNQHKNKLCLLNGFSTNGMTFH